MSALADDYTVGSGDVLEITVFGHEELTTTARISDEGSITFPLIGEVHIGGMQLFTAANKINTLLADGYIVNPQASIFIKEFKSNKVIIYGEVNQPGSFALRGPTLLLEIIYQAGGLTESAGETATLKRTVNGEQKIITIDLEKLIKGNDNSKNIPVVGGDTIAISKAGICYVTGAVARPGAYPCRHNATVHMIITLAGGFKNVASESSVRIYRDVEGNKKIFKNVDLRTPVLPDDVIDVPESFF